MSDDMVKYYSDRVKEYEEIYAWRDPDRQTEQDLMGVELKNAIKQAWWSHFIRDRPDVVGLDSAILMNPRVWEASGHVGGFSDPLVDCKVCKKRFPFCIT